MPAEQVMGSWFRYFPDHYLWSQVMCAQMNLSRFGGSNVQELDQIGKRLAGRTGDTEQWHDAWHWMADKTLVRAEDEDARGHRLTAAEAYVRSAMYRYTSERFVHPDDPRNAASYAKLITDYLKGMQRLMPGMERVEVPYVDGGALPAYWIPPQGGGKGPVVVFFDGLDASKESTVLWGGASLAARGIGVLCVDGPGQGEALRLRKIPSRPDYEVAGTAAFEFIAAHPRVDAKRIGIQAMSMGGYYAPRIAAFEQRYAACFAWGAHFDYHEVWLKRRKVLESGGTVASSAMWQLPWVLGAADMDSAMKKCEAYTLAGVAEKIRMPMMITHGQDDNIVPVEMAHRLYAACGSQQKTLKIFTVEDGGSQHCIIDNLPLISSFMADWWMDRFARA